MSAITKWLHLFDLQFFADGASGSGEGGEGAGTGVESAAAGQSLEDLGVPHDKAERFRQRRSKMQKPAPEVVEQPPAEEPPAEEEKPAVMPWDDFMQIPENQQRLQAMMADRGKKATEAKAAAEATMGKLNPALETLSVMYGIETNDGQYDLDAIVNAVVNDDRAYAQRAEDLGVDISVAKQLEQANREKKMAEAREQALRKQQEKQDREFMLRQHFMSMQQQAAKLKELYPDFDLDRELQNPEFLQLTSPRENQNDPTRGWSVEKAFYALHAQELMDKQADVIARKVKADTAASIRSGVRPRENGSSASAAVQSTPDIRHMPKEERRAYIRNKYGGPG